MRPLRPTGCFALALALAASVCASPATQQDAKGRRLVVRTAADWPDQAAFAERATAVAGVPVTDVRALTPQRFAMTLQCEDKASCSAALQKLSGETGFLRELKAEQRRRLPARPASATAR